MLFQRTFRYFTIALFLFTAACAGDKKIVIVHFNDTHSNMYPIKNSMDQYTGGLARRVTFVELIRAKEKNFLLLHAGDILAGTVFSSVYKGTMDIEVMNKMKYDAMVIGNHEFDYGLSNILALNAMAEFPILSANTFEKGTGKNLFIPYIIKNIDGVKIVIVGLTTSNVGTMNQDVISSLDIKDEASTLKALLDSSKLMETNDILICLTHMGIDMDRELAKAVPAIDLIVGGHTHTAAFVPIQESGTLIVQAGNYGIYAGVLELFVGGGKISSFKYDLVTIDSNTSEDPETVLYISNKNASFKEQMSVKICDSDYFFHHSGIRDVQLPLGNFVADITWMSAPGADFSILNAGSIRSQLTNGTVTLGDVVNLYPFDNTLMVLTLQGKYIREIMNQGVLNQGKGSFLYYSKGVKIVSGGDSPSKITFNGKPLDDQKFYKVAVTDFLAKGGDNYPQFTNYTAKYDTEKNFRDFIIAYLKKIKKIEKKKLDMTVRVVIPE
ncbi:MAG: hypothetical protein A2Y33_15900 [Spirochaetes bacterium GWF1_51_8]|nr:MAG: hypothetical protein A2Y33_15900 [Spirochaetes bacterium GWF1_51_8]